MSTNLVELLVELLISPKNTQWIAQWKAHHQQIQEPPLSHVGLTHHDARRRQAPRDKAQLLLTHRQLAQWGHHPILQNPLESSYPTVAGRNPAPPGMVESLEII